MRTRIRGTLLLAATIAGASTFPGCGEAAPPPSPPREKPQAVDPPLAQGKAGRRKARVTKPPLAPAGASSSGFSEL